MVGLGPQQTESMESQRQDHYHTSKSQSRDKSLVSHEENAENMQKEIDHLERSLRHEQRKQAPSNFDFSSDSEEDGSYRCRSRTPLNKPFSYDEDYHHERRNRNSSLVGLGNDAISKALNQIFKSPFTHWIKGGRLP